MIDLRDVSRRYVVGGRDVHALRDVDLHIPAGDYVSIMGPSGSGKSTLLNIIGCLDRPTSGTYLLDGQAVGALDERALSRIRARKIGFVFQVFHLVPRLTAAANVELPMLLAGIEPRLRADRVARALEAVSLSDRALHRPEQLSGGERQRVAIARAMVMGPAVLLADEPTGQSGSRVRDRDRRAARSDERRGPDADRRHARSGCRTPGADPAPHGRRRARAAETGAGGVMTAFEIVRFAGGALRGHRLRTGLSLLGVAVGVTSVVLLTSLGEGARLYVTGEFASLGSNLLIIMPGRTETTGLAPPIGGAPHDLTLDDAEALRRLPGVRRVAPDGARQRDRPLRRPHARRDGHRRDGGVARRPAHRDGTGAVSAGRRRRTRSVRLRRSDAASNVSCSRAAARSARCCASATSAFASSASWRRAGRASA